MKRHRKDRPRRRNPAAAALASPRFRLRRAEARKGKRGYSRKRTRQKLIEAVREHVPVES